MTNVNRVTGAQNDECVPSYKSPERTNVNRVIRAQNDECEPRYRSTEGRM